MDTLAVVCDDNIECAEDRDEALLCRTGTDKYDPIVYAMTALMGLMYVVIKLHWFFYQRHQPVGDEDDDDDEIKNDGSSISHVCCNAIRDNSLGNSGNSSLEYQWGDGKKNNQQRNTQQ